MKHSKLRNPVTSVVMKERNVDGCGTDVEVPVIFPEGLTEDEISHLKVCVHAVKGRFAPEDQDTDAMVEEALKEFGKSCSKEYAYGRNCVEITF